MLGKQVRGERFLFLSERVPYFSHTHGQGYASYRFPTVALTDSRVRNVVPTALERITARGYPLALCFPFPILNATTMTGRKPYTVRKFKNLELALLLALHVKPCEARARAPVTSNFSVLLPPPQVSHSVCVPFPTPTSGAATPS